MTETSPTRPRRVGLRMREVVQFVDANPHSTTRDASLIVSRSGLAGDGYRTVMRAIAAGLIGRTWVTPHRSRLHVTDAGRELLS